MNSALLTILGSTDSLSPGEIIGLIALLLGVIIGVLTVVAAALTPVLLRQRRDRKQLLEVKRQSRRIDLHVELTAAALAELANYCRLIAGLADAALSEKATIEAAPSSANEWPKLGEVLNRYEESLQRRLRELELLSPDKDSRNHALIELGGGLGDLGTDHILELLTKISDGSKAIQEARQSILSRVSQNENELEVFDIAKRYGTDED